MKQIYLVNSYINNLGDFLIFKGFSDQINLLNENIKIHNIRLKELNEYKFSKNSILIFPGGPMLNNSLETKSLNYGNFLQKTIELKIPVILFGVGLGVNFNFDTGFSKKNKKILQNISKISPIFCRDNITNEFLKKNEINSEVSGCPVLNYKILNKNNSFQNKTLISDPGFRDTSKLIYFLIFCIKLINKESKNEKIEFLFNADFLSREGTSRKRYYTQKLLIKYLEYKNIKILKGHEIIKDNKLFTYKRHIGFRVHTHLLFLANNLDSTLISEDIRGIGQVELLNSYKQELPKALRNINKYIDDEVTNQKNSTVLEYKDLNIQKLKFLKF